MRPKGTVVPIWLWPLSLRGLHHAVISFIHPCMNDVCFRLTPTFAHGIMIIMHCVNMWEVESDTQMVSNIKKSIIISAMC